MKPSNEFVNGMAEAVSMPDVYLDIRQLIASPDARIEDFVKIIEVDSTLTLRIIRIAKSNYFGFQRSAENLYQAISLIGVIQLHDLMLSSLCLRTFSAAPRQMLNQTAFWRYCVHCGIAAKTIAQHCAQPANNQYFTLGLLHEIGHAAMYLKAPEACLKALDDSRKEARPVSKFERRYLGFDYAELGKTLMELWNLPEVYQQVAAFHLQPELSGKRYHNEVAIVNLAHSICQNPKPGCHQKSISDAIENNAQLNRLPADIDNIIFDEINSYAEAILILLWPNSAPPLTSPMDSA